MSQNRYYREAWCSAMLLRTIALFHQARKAEENQSLPLSDLARQCANTVFQDNQHTIVGDKETTAKAFMAACREGFEKEIRKALAEVAPEEARVN